MFSPKLDIRTEEIEEVVLENQREKVEGVVKIEAELANNIPSLSGGVESTLRTLPGVNFNNEMSSAYNVRGGSFEENLVYVHGVEVYRPFLVRAASQEGLIARGEEEAAPGESTTHSGHIHRVWS